MTMMHKFRYMTLLIVILLRSKAAEPIVFRDASVFLNISPYLLIYEDKTGKMDLDEVRLKNFVAKRNRVPNFGITESVLWIKIGIRNLSLENRLLMNLSLPTLDRIALYSPIDSGRYSVVAAGEQFPFYQRKYKDPDYLFDLYIPSGTEKIFYLKVASKEGIQLPVSLGASDVILYNIKNKDILSGIYYGIMCAMILYNLFIFFSVRDRSYIYYVLYIVCVMFTQATIQGYPSQYLWPDNKFMADYNMFIFPVLVGITGMEFMKVFLRVKSYSVILSRFSFVLSGLYILAFVFACLRYYKFSFHLLEVTAMIVSVYMLTTGAIILKRGFQPAKYFLAAWVVFLMGVCVYILKDFEVLPFNSFTRYTMQIGSGIETVLLSFALAARINIYKKEKEDSQARALELSRLNEQIIRELNVKLEEKVKERTAELEAAREQLINSEKMASLGQLTAGISHEINNPINFVVSNVEPLKRDIQDILFVLEKYNGLNLQEDLKTQLAYISEFQKSIDLDLLVSEIHLLLNGIDEGAHRTAEIVRGLKNFSRMQTLELSNANLHEALDSTLAILNNNISSANIKIEKKYGDIPMIECYYGKINQVFMNVLNNAVQAVVARKYKHNEGLISICTGLHGSDVEIRIKDNGIGIPKANQGKLFEPFFTTKEVGAGTGLGLSIVYGIINSHNGSIRVISEENEGAEFIITLPVKHQRKV